MEHLELFENWNSEKGIDPIIFPDLVKGLGDLIWVKEKVGKSVVNYAPYYKGHLVEYGGRNVGSIESLKNLISNYILSINMYNKLKYEKEKPLKYPGPPTELI